MDLREEFKTDPLLKKLLLAILNEECIKRDEMLAEFPEIPEEVLKNSTSEYFEPFDTAALEVICPSLIEVVNSEWEGYRDGSDWVWEISFGGSIYQFSVEYCSWNGVDRDNLPYAISHARKGRLVPKMIQVFEPDA